MKVSSGLCQSSWKFENMKTISPNEVLKHLVIEEYIHILGQKYFKQSTFSHLFHIMLFYFMSQVLYFHLRVKKNMPLQGIEMTINQPGHTPRDSLFSVSVVHSQITLTVTPAALLPSKYGNESPSFTRFSSVPFSIKAVWDSSVIHQSHQRACMFSFFRSYDQKVRCFTSV